ncbi:hypothetical protein FGD67_01135 [Colwellia sp. M166]|uniref:hypothetical protein n=1 Tax=Colwellia sp. M166 TaxID=2583805 RepID=UPI00211DAECB|nr:hypothetical protein [Colwellia sp. M166]UUO21958.1 hypothetical protein FGD67_01135 [Colwellia sp. M166]|tara:strand:+ start:2843 stop:3529 length:687 start_codon:yes stop_codon:yes gene_type:complete
MEIKNTVFQSHSQGVQQSEPLNSNSNFYDIFAAYQEKYAVEEVEKSNEHAVFNMNTTQGDQQEINLDEYLTPGLQSGSVNLNDIPLLLPTAHNIDTLSKYSQKEFNALLAKYDIPSPPATIEFDTEGKLVLPTDYAYAAELKQAFAENPKVENALRTTAALASHYAGIMEGQAFRDEMSIAKTQADRERIADKYSYLFDDNRQGKHIILRFLDDGSMLLGEKNNTTNA